MVCYCCFEEEGGVGLWLVVLVMVLGAFLSDISPISLA